MSIICEKCHAEISITNTGDSNTPSSKIHCDKCGTLHQGTPQGTPDGGTGLEPSGKQSLEQRFADAFGAGEMDAAMVADSPMWKSLESSAEKILHGPALARTWFIAVNGQQVGPVNAKEIHGYQVQQKVSEQSLVYKEGMLGWIPLEDSAELQELLSMLRVQSTLPEGNDRSQTVVGHALHENGQASPFRGATVGAVDSRIDGASSTPTLGGASVAPAYDRSSMSRVSRLSTFFPPPSSLGRNALKWVIAAGIIGLLLGAFFSYIALSMQPPKTIVKEKIIRKTEVVYRDAPIAATDERAISQDGTLSAFSGEKTAKMGRRRGGKKSETSDERKKRLLAQLSSPRTDNASSETKGTGLSQKQMGAVVSKNRSSLQLCYERALKKGLAPAYQDIKVVFNVKVGTSGMVKSVAMSGSGARILEMKKCLKSAVKRWMFPASSGSSAVQFPIVFTPSR